jgi:hypothetical protein
MYLPDDIQEIIWEFYWKDIYKNQVINEFNYLINLDHYLFKFVNNNEFLKIRQDKEPQYSKINNIVKKCLNTKSFKIITKSRFFKDSYLINYNNEIKENYKFILSFMVFYSGYMSMKVFYDFQKIIIN